jgi:hypothetical protein
MSVKIAGFGDVTAEVNADREQLTVLNLDPEKVGFVTLACESDSGSAIGTRVVRNIDISQDYRMRVGVDTPLFNAKFPGAALDTGRWNQILSTMTATVASGFLTLNAGLSTASGTYAQVRTFRHFPVLGTFGIWGECTLQMARVPLANNVVEVGFMLAATNAAPTDGVFLRYTSLGVAELIVNFAGSETQSPPFDADTLIAQNRTRKVAIGIVGQEAELWIDDVLVAHVTLPDGVGDLTASAALPWAIRIYNSGVTVTPQVVKIGMVNVTIADANTSKLWSQVMAGLGGMGYEGQVGGTMGSTALYSNNLARARGSPRRTRPRRSGVASVGSLRCSQHSRRARTESSAATRCRWVRTRCRGSALSSRGLRSAAS